MTGSPPTQRDAAPTHSRDVAPPQAQHAGVGWWHLVSVGAAHGATPSNAWQLCDVTWPLNSTQRSQCSIRHLGHSQLGCEAGAAESGALLDVMAGPCRVLLDTAEKDATSLPDVAAMTGAARERAQMSRGRMWL